MLREAREDESLFQFSIIRDGEGQRNKDHDQPDARIALLLIPYHHGRRCKDVQPGWFRLF